MKRKYLSLIAALMFLVGLGLLYFFGKKDYQNKMDAQLFTGTIASSTIDDCARFFYRLNGEYPLDIMPPSNYLYSEDTLFNKVTITNNFNFEDDFSRNKGQQLAYYPLYNPENKLRESFILLSAGVDGKLNNRFSYTDSLFMDSWWEKVALYNFAEMITYKYRNDSRAAPTQKLGYVSVPATDIVIEIWNQYDIYPKFSAVDYFFGKKDVIVQLDSLHFYYKEDK